MRIEKLSPQNLKKLVALTKRSLLGNNLVIIPTDTVYGLAANANSAKAVKKIYDFKGRKFGKGVSVFLNNLGEIENYAFCTPDQRRIIKTLLPGPFTVVLNSKKKTAPEIEAKDKTIGIRVINYPFVKELTEIASFPVTATSANISGKGPHYLTGSLLKTLSEKKKKMIDLVIDAGKLPKKPTSTVVSLKKDEVEILRKGTFNLRFLAKYKTSQPEETKRVAKKIFQDYFQKALKKKAVLVILKGKLGVGKTVFAQGIGQLFDQHFTSPAFVLMEEYPIKKAPVENIYHLDLYRIESLEEILELKLEKLLSCGNLLLIEWGEKLSSFQNLKRREGIFYLVQIEELKNEERQIKLYRL